jgi:hypothetical protein
MSSAPAVAGQSAGDYAAFLASKHYAAAAYGMPIDEGRLPAALFPFQRALTAWALSQGRAALFADTGLGKTLMELAWADCVVRHTNKPVLVLTPLAVGAQTVREAEKFGIECRRSMDGRVGPGACVVVANYERLHHFDPADFGGAVGDESGVIKHFTGVRQRAVTDFMRHFAYRLLATATPAPNDYIELGTSSEALGYLGRMDMLSTFFTTDGGSLHPSAFGAKYRFKAHAERPFWRYICSWARALRRPSDMGFDDGAFALPPLLTQEHVVTNWKPLPGSLFVLPAATLAEQREERRLTLDERCEKVAALLSHDRPAVAWCHLNDEGDLLDRLIPGAVQVSGAEPDEAKEEKLLAFAAGQARALVTKPTIAGFGLNWQHCAHMTFFPSHSFEQYYQGVRRCWRYGQQRPVTVDIVTTEGELGVLKNLQRKAEAAERMFEQLVAHMNDALGVSRTQTRVTPIEVPAWL